jgi:hypothetical protein
MSRTFAGHGSDGLVRIENATLWGLRSDGSSGDPCAKAFAYRSHSGYFGIVNSEEAYQNLTRFLFGDVRVDIWVDVEEIRLPKEVQQAADAGTPVNALYQFEVMASPRGKPWYLTRRTAEEDSVACMSHVDWTEDPQKHGPQYVSTVFLANRAKVNPRRRSLSYAMTLGVRVPDYEVDRKLWFDKHYEGGYLFRDAIVLELVPPRSDQEPWKISYAWQSKNTGSADQVVEAVPLGGGKIDVRIPFVSPSTPGIRGNLRFVVQAWNEDAK